MSGYIGTNDGDTEDVAMEIFTLVMMMVMIVVM
jgi:hypothetical protein